MRNFWGNKWVLISGVIIIAAVVGVGFIPVTRSHTVAYDCFRTEQYDCVKYRDVERCELVPKEQPLSYTTWGAGYDESWWDCDIWMWINVRNTDTEGGYFRVDFQCSTDVPYEGWHTKTQTKYLGPNDSAEFKVEFQHSCGTPWDRRSPEVIPDTKTSWVEECRIEQEPYNAICTREVPATCYREENKDEWLFWPKP